MAIWDKVITGIRNDFKASLRVVRFRSDGPNVALTETSQPAYYSQMTRSNVWVTEDVALTVPAIYSAVTLISSAIGGLPIDVYQMVLGARVPMNTPETKLLTTQPNPEMSPMAFWETLVLHEVLWGNAFIFVVKNEAGRALELWPLAPWRVHVDRASNKRKFYEVDWGSQEKAVLYDFSIGGEIIHIPNTSKDGMVGLRPVEVLKDSIALSKAAEEYAARFFGDDSTPNGVISVPATTPVTRDQLRAMAEDWEQQHRAKRTVGALGNGATYAQTSVNPDDSQLLEQRQFQVAESARIFRVPPHLIADVERSTSWGTGIEEQARNFVQFSLNPHLVRFEQAINTHLLRRPQSDRYMKFNVNSLLRADISKRFAVYQIGIGNRIMTPNEARALEDWSPIEGGDEMLPMPTATPPAIAAPAGGEEPPP